MLLRVNAADANTCTVSVHVTHHLSHELMDGTQWLVYVLCTVLLWPC